MNLQNASTGNGIMNEVRYLTNTDDNSYPDLDLKRNINRYYHLVVGEILASMDDWDFQGEIATTDLKADQREYYFPMDCLRIKRVELKLDGTNYKVATFFDINETGKVLATEADITSEFDNDNPYVDMYDQSMFIFSGPVKDVTDGIMVWYEDEVTELSADTDEPLIAEPYQRALVYGASKDFFARLEMKDRTQEMDGELEKTLSRLRNFYGNKNADRKFILKSATSSEDYE